MWSGDISLPYNAFLSDASVFHIRNAAVQTTLGQRWPADFVRKRHLRLNRLPKGPTFWVRSTLCSEH